jgi:hypothetical protein
MCRRAVAYRRLKTGWSDSDAPASAEVDAVSEGQFVAKSVA